MAWENHTKLDIDQGVLDAIPEGGSVAVVTMTGSCCPVTLAHIQCFIESRRILLGEAQRPKRLEKFDEVLGFLAINPDSHVQRKMQEKGLRHIPYGARAMLIGLATDDLPWMCLNPSREMHTVQEVQRRRPDVWVTRFSLNGADDVLKYEKWRGCGRNKRSITMGRPGETEKLLGKIRKAGIDPEQGWFIVGPELPDVSSTAVRKALAAADIETLHTMLHPHVAEWCLTESPYRPAPEVLQQLQQRRTADLAKQSTASSTLMQSTPGISQAGSSGAQMQKEPQPTPMHSGGPDVTQDVQAHSQSALPANGIARRWQRPQAT